ncbi:hypothetical protein G6011_06049 [Alternaria panax]|uniref:Uncharacterized protein n=1 Tax=Alternaria panax TaxID=48097 RepID=A0AAD4FI84_9PLEO|nr:hypothetical protein G6011_06049 [Alternaria panax]
MASPPVVFFADDQNLETPPQLLSPTASQAQQQKPATTTGNLEEDRRPNGKRVDTPSAGQVEVTPCADTKLQPGCSINQPSMMEQNQKQHSGAALNLSNFNAQNQNQTSNLSHNAPSLTPSLDGECPGGSDMRRGQSD